MDVIITGHTGFIGSAVKAACDENGLTSYGASKSVGIDLEKPDALKDVPKSRFIIHTAGLIGPAESWEAPASFYRNNVMSTINVCEHARMTGAKVIHLSSYLYGIPIKNHVDEEHPIDCTNPYARSKRAAETICESYAADFGVEITILRPFNVYGPNQSQNQLIPHVIRQALKDSRISVASLTPRRDYLWVSDLAEAVLALLLVEQNRKIDIFNVGSGVSHSVSEIIDQVVNLTGKCDVICSEPRWVDSIPDCVCNATKLRNRVGWAPSTPLELGLRRLIST